MVAKLLCHPGETSLHFLISALGRQALRPVERQIKMAAPGVEFPHLAGGRLAVFQKGADGLIQGFGKERRLVIFAGAVHMLKRRDQGTELTQGVPAQMAFLEELLHMLGRRTARAGLEHAAAVHQRHDGQHFRAGAQFQDGEEVGEIVAQHIAGNGNGVFPFANAEK